MQDDFSKANIDNRDAEGDTALLRAARLNATAEILYLLDQGANPALADKVGNTPLLLATKAQNIVVVRALIALHADVTTENRDGEKPIDIALRTGNTELVCLFEQPLLRILGGIPCAEAACARYSARLVGDTGEHPTGDTISLVAPLGQATVSPAFTKAGNRDPQALTAPRAPQVEMTAHELRGLFSK